MRVHPGIYWSFYFLFLAHSCLEKKVSSHCEKCVSTFPRASWPSPLPGHAVAGLRGGIEFPRRPARKSRRRISHRVFRAKSPDREGERPPRLSSPHPLLSSLQKTHFRVNCTEAPWARRRTSVMQRQAGIARAAQKGHRERCSCLIRGNPQALCSTSQRRLRWQWCCQ